MKAELNDASTKIEQANVELQSAQLKLADYENRSRDLQAHNWWLQVWRESYQATERDESPEADKVTDSALEVTRLRQKVILIETLAQKERNGLMDRLSKAELEIIRLNSVLRDGRTEDKVRVSELENIVEELRSKSELHSRYALARQELTDEKILTMQLRFDSESHHQALTAERRKLEDAKKALEEMAFEITRRKIRESIVGIEAVSPSSIIAAFAGRMATLEEELALATATLKGIRLSGTNVLPCTEEANPQSLDRHQDTAFNELLENGEIMEEIKSGGVRIRELRNKTALQKMSNYISRLSNEFAQLNRKYILAEATAGEQERNLIASLKERITFLEQDAKQKDEEAVHLKQKVLRLEGIVAIQELEAETRKFTSDPDVNTSALATVPYQASPTTEETVNEDSTELKQSKFENKVLRETLRVLQDGVQPTENDPPNRPKTNKGVSAAPSKGVKLLKRTIELTFQLSNANSQKLFAEQLLKNAEERGDRVSLELSGVRSELGTSKAEVDELKGSVVSLKDKLKSLLQSQLEEQSKHSTDLDELKQALHHAELKIHSQNQIIQQLSAQLNTPAGTEAMPFLMVPQHRSDDGGLLRSDFLSKSTALIDEVNRFDLGSINQAEAELQHLKSSAREVLREIFRASIGGTSYDIIPTIDDLHTKMISESLNICIEHLRHYQRRAWAFLSILTEKNRINSDSLSGSLQVIRNALKRADDKHLYIAKKYSEERTRRCIAEGKYAAQEALINTLERRISELKTCEVSLKSRDSALEGMLQYIRQVERSMFEWRQIELPILISQNFNVEAADISNSHIDSVAELSNMTESERCACLTHTLCMMKSEISETSLQNAYLAEANENLKRKAILLESQLLESAAKIESKSAAAVERAESENQAHTESQEYVSWSAVQMAELDRKVLVLEEELSRAQHEKKSADTQCEHLLRLVKEAIDGESSRSEEHSKQVAALKLRYELEIAAARRETSQLSSVCETPRRTSELCAPFSNASDAIGLSVPAVHPIEPYAETPLEVQGGESIETFKQPNNDDRLLRHHASARQTTATKEVGIISLVICGDDSF